MLQGQYRWNGSEEGNMKPKSLKRPKESYPFIFA